MATPSTFSGFAGLLKRDLTIAFRARSQVFNPVIFFVIIVALFPLGTSAEQQTLRTLAPGVIWVAALLASLLSLDSVFRSDYDDGALEQIMISPQPLSVLVFAKVLAHWLMSGLPLVLISPLLGALMYLPDEALWSLLLTLLLGTPVLSMVGAIGVALTVSLRRGGVLLGLLILPLYVPVLIFAASAIDAAMHSLPYSGQLQLLGAFLVLSLTLTPWATASALRITMD